MNSGRYSDAFRNRLKPAIRSKRRGLSSSDVCLQHVNARPHTARHTVKQIQDFKLPVRHIRPDLAPSDFRHFWPLKDALRRRNLRSDEEVKKTVHDWLVQQPNDFFRGIYALVERWERCVERDGDLRRRLMSLYCIYYCTISRYIFLSQCHTYQAPSSITPFYQSTPVHYTVHCKSHTNFHSDAFRQLPMPSSGISVYCYFLFNTSGS